ncbi:MAG: enterochelin esterase family protein [Candidatus Azotimanducaceae bacterium]|jgi:enterochelin esterase-like enzyme
MSRSPDNNASIKSCVLKDYTHPLCQSVLDGKLSTDGFWLQIAQSGTPLTEADPDHDDCSLITFVFQNDTEANTISVENRFGQPVDQKMQLIDGTDILHLSYRLENDSRLSYAFVHNMPPVNMDTGDTVERKALLDFIESANFIPDPFNTQRSPPISQNGDGSLLALKDSLSDEYAKKRAGIHLEIDRGWLHEEEFVSEVLGNTRKVWIYTPAGYDHSDEIYPVLLLLDGATQISVGHTHRILDNLIADKKIPPLIAVFIDNAAEPARDLELPCSDTFAEFMESELIPWLYHHFPIRSLPTDWYVTGVSYGGLASLWLGYKMPHQIGNVISQSGSFWWGTGYPIGEAVNPSTADYQRQLMIKTIASTDRLPLRVWLEVGKLEPNELIESNRLMRDALQEKNYDMVYHEFGGTHQFSHWQTSLPLALMHMMGL